LDDKDRKILNILQRNSKVSHTYIANELGVSEATVRYRIKNLIDEGVIDKFTVLLNPKKVGYPTIGILMVKIAPDCFEQTSEQISDLTETYHVFQSTGEYNLVAVVHAHNLEHLNDLRKRVERMTGVRDVSLSAATRLIKIKTSFDL
jgi:Lrp/AsnC family transcriptional regulator for asnA, asnC and gidA